MRSSTRETVALVGMPGAGKSSVARVLAGGETSRTIDLDAVIEEAEGRPIETIFAESGEAFFRRREAECLGEVLGRRVAWLSCGGGVVLDEGNRRLLRERCDIVWLQVRPAEAVRRLSLSGAPRPPLRGASDPCRRMEELLQARELFYRELADLVVATDGRTVDEVAIEVRAWARSRRVAS